MRGLHALDLGDDEDEVGRWLQSLRLIHPYREQLDSRVLVVLGAILACHFLCSYRHDFLPDRPPFCLGQGAEYASQGW